MHHTLWSCKLIIKPQDFGSTLSFCQNSQPGPATDSRSALRSTENYYQKRAKKHKELLSEVYKEVQRTTIRNVQRQEVRRNTGRSALRSREKYYQKCTKKYEEILSEMY